MRNAIYVHTCIVIFAMLGSSPALAESRHLCEQDVTFTLAAADPKAPPTSVAFEGVWLGKIEALCSALIVESVAPDGTASAIYVNGTYGPWRITQAGNYRTTAKIRGEILTIELPNRAEVQYKIAGPTKLDGTYTSRGNNYPGSFVKQ